MNAEINIGDFDGGVRYEHGKVTVYNAVEPKSNFSVYFLESGPHEK